MPKQKYDRPALKLEFFQSDTDEVFDFLKQKFGEKLAKSSLKNKTLWWSKDKQEYKNKIIEKALMDNANKQAKWLEIPMEQLSLAKKNAVIKVIQMMMDKDNPLDISDMERTIKIIRTEMWLPTTYSKNENMNTEKIEWIHIVMWGNLIDSSKNIENNA